MRARWCYAHQKVSNERAREMLIPSAVLLKCSDYELKRLRGCSGSDRSRKRDAELNRVYSRDNR